MGIIVRLLSTGMGLTSEAIHHSRSRSRSHSENPDASPSNAPPRVTSVPDAPPEYVEVANAAAADELIRSGRAERVTDYGNEKKSRGLLSAEDRPSRSGYQSKAAEAGYEDGDESDSDSDALTDAGADEAAWELDEMVERVVPPTYEESEASPTPEPEEVVKQKREQMVRNLVAMAGPVPQPASRLPCPVVIPQRRPRYKDRGFVRAYAPVMADCGISQAVFLQFLADWHKASKSSPWIDVVFIAASVVGFVPSVSAQVVSTVVQVVAGTARELQSRSRRNTFLDMVNQDLFMPRGMYAMLMAFKDDIPERQSGPLARVASQLGQTLVASERLDINQTVAKYSNPNPNMSSLQKSLKGIRLTSGKTHGEIELPEAAELVFPDLDRAVDSELNPNGKGKGAQKEGFMDKMKGAGDFVSDYIDRRLQARYEMEHQGSALNVPASARAPFASRFSDPSHPANSGSLIALFTGGAIDPSGRRQAKRARKEERRAAKRDYKDARRVARGRSPRGPRQPRATPDGKRIKKKGIIKKIMQQDVLYLLVVNLPTEEELQQSVARLEHIIDEAQR